MTKWLRYLRVAGHVYYDQNYNVTLKLCWYFCHKWLSEKELFSGSYTMSTNLSGKYSIVKKILFLEFINSKQYFRMLLSTLEILVLWEMLCFKSSRYRTDTILINQHTSFQWEFRLEESWHEHKITIVSFTQ